MLPEASDILNPDISKEMLRDYAEHLYLMKEEYRQQLNKLRTQLAEYEQKIKDLEKLTKEAVVPNEQPTVEEAKKQFDLSFLWQTKGADGKRNLDKFYAILKSCGRKAEVCRRLAEWNGVYFNFGRFSNKQKANLVNQFAADFGFPPFTDEDFKKNWILPANSKK